MVSFRSEQTSSIGPLSAAPASEPWPPSSPLPPLSPSPGFDEGDGDGDDVSLTMTLHRGLTTAFAVAFACVVSVAGTADLPTGLSDSTPTVNDTGGPAASHVRT